MSAPSPVRLVTERLVLDLPGTEHAQAVSDYYARNAAHLGPWEPRRPEGFETLAFHRAQLAGGRQDFQQDRAMRLYLRLRAEPSRVIGSCGLANFQRGALQACSIGYGIAADVQGQGLMGEAVERVVAYAFEDLGFHRVTAAYLPENDRSARLLRRLGFVVEGYARSYIQISGRWRDHVLTSRLAPAMPVILGQAPADS